MNRRETLLRLDLISALSQIVRTLDQLNLDVESWNGLHPEHPPVDIERNRLALDRAKKCLELVASHQNCQKEWAELQEFLEE